MRVGSMGLMSLENRYSSTVPIKALRSPERNMADEKIGRIKKYMTVITIPTTLRPKRQSALGSPSSKLKKNNSKEVKKAIIAHPVNPEAKTGLPQKLHSDIKITARITKKMSLVFIVFMCYVKKRIPE